MDGAGSASDPFLVSTVEELQAVRTRLSAHFILGGDIDASGTSGWNELIDAGPWEENRAYRQNDIVTHGDPQQRYYCLYGNTGVEPGADDSSGAYWSKTSLEAGDFLGFEPVGCGESGFGGSLDGDGHLVRNLFINRDGADCAGLFGHVLPGAEVSNIGIENVFVRGQSGAGALAGVNGGILSRSYASGRVEGEVFTGGLTGHNKGYVSDSYAAVNVRGGVFTGGFAGANEGVIADSYSKGFVYGNIDAGGFSGRNFNSISGCFYHRQRSGQSDTGKGEPKSEAGMKSIETYTDTGSPALEEPWDIVLIGDYGGETWFIDDGNDYPRLGWQHRAVPEGPLPPSGFSVEPVAAPGYSNRITWTPPGDDGAVRYNLYVSTGGESYGGGEDDLMFWFLAAFGPDDDEFMHRGLSRNVRYYYVMTAEDAEGLESGFTSEVRWAVPGTGETGSSAPIAWGPERVIQGDKGSGSSLCFAAGAAYGSPYAGEVLLLRRFRDGFFLKSRQGMVLVRCYYAFGPYAAGVIGENRLLRIVVRLHIAPALRAADFILAGE